MNASDELFSLWLKHGVSSESDSSEGRELADAILAAGYSKPAPPTTEAINAAAQSVYAKTHPSTSIAWELLPRIVQHEIREVALTAINAATAATP